VGNRAKLWVKTPTLQKIKLDSKEVWSQKFYYQVKYTFEEIGQRIKPNDEIMFYKDLFKNIPSDYDVYVFVPMGCFRYLFDFVNKENYEKIMLYTYHSDTEETHKEVCFKKDLKGKKVLIVDNSYSGSTLTNIKYILEEQGSLAQRLSLFPKSKLAVRNSEYSFVFDKCFDSGKIDTSKQDWMIDLYKKAVIN
jgi:hypoxanthine-guanine phosphoribosyltransferase